MSLAPDSAQRLVCPSPVEVSPFPCCLSVKICRQIAPEGGAVKLLNICRAWKTENRLLPCPPDTLPASQAVGQYKAGMRVVQN